MKRSLLLLSAFCCRATTLAEESASVSASAERLLPLRRLHEAQRQQQQHEQSLPSLQPPIQQEEAQQPSQNIRGTRKVCPPSAGDPVCCRGTVYVNLCTAMRRHGIPVAECALDDMHDPVCCRGTEEYFNPCDAVEQGRLLDTECVAGPCAALDCDNDVDSITHEPVCCGDTEEYFNSCQAAADGRLIDSECVAGPCEPECDDTADGPQVCCYGTEDYDNYCQAKAVLQQDVATACIPGECPPWNVLPCPPSSTATTPVCCDQGRRQFPSLRNNP